MAESRCRAHLDSGLGCSLVAWEVFVQYGTILEDSRAARDKMAANLEQLIRNRARLESTVADTDRGWRRGERKGASVIVRLESRLASLPIIEQAKGVLIDAPRDVKGSFSVPLVGSSAGVAAQLGWAMEGKLLVGQRSLPDEIVEKGGGGSADRS
jgi:hypothetical protein